MSPFLLGHSAQIVNFDLCQIHNMKGENQYV
jgi:hypothetical protein